MRTRPVYQLYPFVIAKTRSCTSVSSHPQSSGVESPVSGLAMTSRPHGEPFITPRQKLVNGRGLDHCWVSIALRLDQSAAFRTLYGSFSAGIYDGKVSS